jgi:hypothetical protein
MGPRSSTARQPVTNHEGQVAPGRHSYWLVKLPPAAREKLVEKGVINAEHHGRRAHHPARASGNCLGGSGIMLFGEHSQIPADIWKRRLCQHQLGIVANMPCACSSSRGR